MSVATIFLSSDDKAVQSDSNSSFYVNLAERISTQKCYGVSIKEISVPNSQYNIRSQGAQNNIILFKENGQPDAQVIIPEGQYTISTFMAAIQSGMNAVLVSGTVAVSQVALTQKIQMVYTGTSAIMYNKSDGNLAADAMGVFTTSVDTANYISDYPPDLSGYQLLNLHCKQISRNGSIASSFGFTNAIETISFHNTPYGAYSVKENETEDFNLNEYDDVNNIGRLEIRLRDLQGNIVDIGTKKLFIVIRCYFR